MPHWTKSFPAQLWLNKLLLFFVIYFYSKEFVSLSQKLDNHTTNSSKVHRVTWMVESSLGIPQCPKGHKGGKKRKRKKYSKQIQNPWWLWGETSHDSFCLLLLSAADVFQPDQVRFNLSKPFIPTLAPNREKEESV